MLHLASRVSVLCSFFKGKNWTGSEMSPKWPLFYFQGGSSRFDLKASHSRSECAVSSSSPRRWQRSRVFLKFTSVQAESVGISWELGSNMAPPGHRTTCQSLALRCMRSEMKCFTCHEKQLVWKTKGIIPMKPSLLSHWFPACFSPPSSLTVKDTITSLWCIICVRVWVTSIMLSVDV